MSEHAAPGPDPLDRLLESERHAGSVTFGRAAELLPDWTPAELREAAYGAPPIIPVVRVGDRDELDLAALVWLATASLRYPRDYAPPADE